MDHDMMLRVLAGGPVTDPASFADCVLHRLRSELSVLRESLLVESPNLDETADAVWAMRDRVDGALHVLEQLRKAAP